MAIISRAQRPYLNARSFGNQRRFLAQRLLKALAPRMRDSGYRKALDPSKGFLGGSRPLRMWCPPKRRDGGDQTIPGFVITDVIAITEDGVMTDAAGGGAVTTYWAGIPLEDLVLIEKHLDRWFALEAAEIAKAA